MASLKVLLERAAAEAMLDEEHAAPTGFTRHRTDTNVYTWGRMGEHNIVIAALASGDPLGIIDVDNPPEPDLEEYYC